MSEQVFDPVEAAGHDGAEIKRLRALLAELRDRFSKRRGLLHFAECERHLADEDTELIARIDAALEKR